MSDTRTRPALCPSPCPGSSLGTKQTKALNFTAPLNKCKVQDLQLSLGPGKGPPSLKGVTGRKAGPWELPGKET